MDDRENHKVQALANYHQLLAKVDGKFAEIRARHESAFQCAKGCHSCCKTGRSVGKLEAYAIDEWLRRRPEIKAKIAALVEANPHGGKRCRLLEADGTCTIYETRPIVCRSHGAPLKYREKETELRDVCPLNFGGDVSSLKGEDVINLDMLNTLLVLIGQQFGAGEERVSLETSWLT